MKVHAFRIEMTDGSLPLENVLQSIQAQTDLRERIKIVNQTELRAESIENMNGLWLMDFVKIRTDHGPGKVGRDTQVEGFDFDPDEGFGEETAGLYDPNSQYMLLQYNHFGVRSSAIADYLSIFHETMNNRYTLKPKYDGDVERRLLNQGITRRVTFAIDVSKLTREDRQRGAPLSEAIEYGRSVGADRIKVEISVHGDRGRGLTERARDGLNSLRAIFPQNPDAVKKLEVAGKVNGDSVTEVLDLIAHRLALEFNDLTVGTDLRYPKEERWRALLRAKHAWNQVLRP